MVPCSTSRDLFNSHYHNGFITFLSRSFEVVFKLPQARTHILSVRRARAGAVEGDNEVRPGDCSEEGLGWKAKATGAVAVASGGGNMQSEAEAEQRVVLKELLETRGEHLRQNASGSDTKK